MRALYLLAGLLLGIIFVSDAGVAVANRIERERERDAHIYTLTGFHEGWQRGREQTTGRYQQLLTYCFEEDMRRLK